MTLFEIEKGILITAAVSFGSFVERLAQKVFWRLATIHDLCMRRSRECRHGRKCKEQENTR
ncbi:hypothetical protein A3C21_03130 [Candidatus Kaiserbacteria bacterium RIFCSPHIGHO2_02_FULL_59_21]|uniref:Uncharacterized protein n=1 Tax=Candidatus Kaiserbacteria bacterium RIFCSPHIGHO2_02_FULL_59_21 TaxID=1798500 RepID=A0A1F6DZ33_9BACT|nr:MAG: hypothetical protein A2766_00460 [Candidatus Kaiserbacteria bacterium RIFCSPHIGHO2_01_FULL_58_22]OGG66656.1 MAG: hypothetical protein A3C21_03130 [Candidatus Kaiserbacteria bacterium RIFCSPHIGHO2_02_FULL_59_21]OGG78969.1 MAG: hypothetical protein A2952_01225 [Candidatus Kaiserbacteria bacterium RIFCSPLOWO2_01_FULL_59_34]OGG84407.1 MAG: hypothetical protein A3I47_01980 [Candidatus Kaiserbacteria bacterium RIFCSPLOWO2_02_FULL_59_19]